MTTPKPKTSERSTAFMLEEFRFLKASYEGTMTWRDERFKNFINIIFGIVALLTIIAQLSDNNSVLSFSTIIISFISYLYGWFIFSRLVAGSFKIDEYRDAINQVRKYFLDLDTDLEAYLVLPVERPKTMSKKRKLGSGLLGTTALTNSLLILVFGLTTMLQIAKWQTPPSVGIGLIMAATSWFIHLAYYREQAQKNAK